MTESRYYHIALESTLLNAASMKERIDASIVRLPKKTRKTVHISKGVLIAVIAAALLLISSVAVAATILRNQAFKEQTHAELEQTIQTVTQPLNVEQNKGWQPYQLILYDNVLGIREDVTDTFSGGTIQLAEISFSKSTWLSARFFIHDKKDAKHTMTDLHVTVNDDTPKKSTYVTPVDQYYDGHFNVDANYAVGSNPFWPGTTFRFDGKIDGEAFELTYTFSEEIYEHLQQSIVQSAKEHESIVNAIPDEGSTVGYHYKHRTLAEVAVANNCMYFTEVNDPGDWTDKTQPPYSEYDKGLWPAIDGRISEFFYLGNVDSVHENGVVYSTYLPYTPDMLPQESLISFMGVVFRYEWATGKVTIPKDDAEYEAWRKESMELSEPYCENDWIWQFEGQGEDFTVTDLIFHNQSLSGEIGIVFRSEEPFDAGEVIDTTETAPVVSINGIPLKHLGEVDPLENIYGGVSKDRHRKGYMMVGCATADLPKTFVLTVTWHGSTVEIPLNRSDVRLEKGSEKAESYYQQVFGY